MVIWWFTLQFVIFDQLDNYSDGIKLSNKTKNKKKYNKNVLFYYFMKTLIRSATFI